MLSPAVAATAWVSVASLLAATSIGARGCADGPRGVAHSTIESGVGRWRLSPAGESSEQNLLSDVAISPDGSRMVFVRLLAPPRNLGLFCLLDRCTAGADPRCRQAPHSPQPVLLARWKLYRLSCEANTLKISCPSAAARPITICTIGGPRGASWGVDETIVFATGAQFHGLWRVPAAGGKPEPLTTLYRGEGESDSCVPRVPARREALLFTIRTAKRPYRKQRRRRSLSWTENIRFSCKAGVSLATPPLGHIVYSVYPTLHAVAFYTERLARTASPSPSSSASSLTPRHGSEFRYRSQRTLVYLAGASVSVHREHSCACIGRGVEEFIPAPARSYMYLTRCRPRAARGAPVLTDGQFDVFICDLKRKHCTIR